MVSGHRFGVKDKNYNNYWEKRIAKSRTGFSPIHHRIIELVNSYVKKGSRILDLGVGPGQVFKELQKNHIVYGVEISDEAFKLYDFPHENIKKGDLEKAVPDFPDVPENKFDFIIASHIVHHFDNPEEFIERLKKNLSDKGKLLIATPNTTFINHRIRYMFGGEFPGISRAHINFLTPTEYIKIFKEKGYTTALATGIYHYPFLSKHLPSIFSPTLFYILEQS